jgi:hypothetical protein
MKIIAFWDIAPCSLVGVDRRFREVRSASIIREMLALMMVAVRTSETSVYCNETTRRYIPEGYFLHTCRRENLKSHVFHTSDSIYIYVADSVGY